jgi:VWFA-related protein
VRPSPFLEPLFFAVVLLGNPAAWAGPAETPPPGTGTDLVERAEAHLVQVDVSVIDPRADSYRSVPGLAADRFDIRLDGRPLTPQDRAALRFDPICDAAADGMPRPILAIVDFNYVDARGRAKVADAIDGLAAGALSRPEVYKVYALTRQVRELTAGFTRDPARLREAAAAIRAVAYRGDDSPQALAGALASDDLSFVIALGSGKGGGGISAPLPAATALRAEVLEVNLAGAAPAGGVGLYSPQATLSAVEGVLQAHTQLPGRKVAVLFSSPRFRFLGAESEKLERSLRPVFDVAQQGFAIWTVDAEGLSGGGGNSEILSSLANDSGGRAVRNVSDLGVALAGAAEQLSCYYLFSLPIAPGGTTQRHTLSVKLDTDRFKELWGLRVMAPSQLAVEARSASLTRQRVAALLAPDDFDRPPVSAMLDFPTTLQGKNVLLSRFRVPLSELTWVPVGDGGFGARVLVDAVVQRDNGAGLDPVCQVGGETLGEIALRLPKLPPPGARAGFTIEVPCSYRKDGLHVARGVVTDLEAGSAGAGRSTVAIRQGGRDEWTAMAARVEAASGLDLVWRPGMTVAKRESGRGAFRVVDEKRPADGGDRVSLSYLLCGPDRAAARRSVRHLLVSTAADGARSVQPLPESALTLAEPDGSGSFCTQARLAIPEFTLTDGRYTFAVVDAKADAEAVAATIGAGGTAGAAPPTGLLASTAFRVGP